jgi:branched-chain amino acid transport system substrate-binding protein
MSRSFNSIRRNTVTALMIAGLILNTSACDPVMEPTEIPVGVILPLSGTLSVAGQSVMNGMDLALEEINARESFRLRFIVEDGKSNVDSALAAYTRLADDHRVPAIIGPATSTETERAIPLINNKKIATLSPTAARSGLSTQSEFLFQSSLTVGRTVPEGVRISKKHLGYENVATLVNKVDAFSVSSNDFITQELGMYNDVTIVHADSYRLPQGTSFGDITAQLTAIQNAVPTPDVIFLSALPEGRIGALIAAHRLGLRIPFIVNYISIGAIQAVNDAEPGAAEGTITFQVWLPNSSVEESRKFVDSYRSKFGEEPGDFAARGYAAVTILGEALNRVSMYDATSIKDGLARIKEFNSIFGSFSFDENGEAVTSPVIAQVQNNKFEVLDN